MSWRHNFADLFIGQDQVYQAENGIPDKYIDVQEEPVDFEENSHAEDLGAVGDDDKPGQTWGI